MLKVGSIRTTNTNSLAPWKKKKEHNKMKITLKVKSILALVAGIGASVPTMFVQATDGYDTAFTGLIDYVSDFLIAHVPEVLLVVGALVAMGVLYGIVRRRLGKKL